MIDDQTAVSQIFRRRRSILFGSLGAIPLTIFAQEAKAGSVSKGALHYQDSPKDGSRCADCAAYIGGTSEHPEEAACKLVAGPISANGWCIAFSKR